MGAAMQGGVGGHAGLFSNANDLAKLMQMYLQNGVYAGERYLSEEVVKEFTKCQFPDNENRRGAGFDKAALADQEGGPASQNASSEGFGHTGFTGTLAWADPKTQIVYVFFSVALLAWALPSTSGPQQGVSEKQGMAEESFVNTPDQDSWFKRQIIYVPRRNDWPVVVDPSLQPWPGANEWN